MSAAADKPVTREAVAGDLTGFAATLDDPLAGFSPNVLRGTDDANAQLLVQFCGTQLRWCKGLGWLAWDGRRWRPDDISALAVARALPALLYNLAGTASAKGKESLAGTLGEVAKMLSSAPRISAAMSLARTELQVQAAQLDADPLVLNVQNGTLDLRSRELRPHDPGDLITRLAPVDYVAGARDDDWSRYLRETCAGQDGLEGFLQRAAGCSMTGDPDERMFIPHGPGGYGKTTFTDALAAMLGEYAGSIRAESLMESRNPGAAGGHNEDVARTRGVRMLVASEPSDRQRLNAGLVKTLTGGGTYSASFKGQPVFDFKPAFTLWMPANDIPRMRSDDSGLARRVFTPAFANKPARPDRRLKKGLVTRAAARSAVLAWALGGYTAWQEGGLQPPECVRRHTGEMWQSQDRGAQFIDDCLVFGEGLTVSNTQLRWSFDRWAEEEGLAPFERLPTKEIGNRLAKRGCVQGRSSTNRFWKGAGMRADVPDAALPSDAVTQMTPFSQEQLSPIDTATTGKTASQPSLRHYPQVGELSENDFAAMWARADHTAGP